MYINIDTKGGVKGGGGGEERQGLAVSQSAAKKSINILALK